MSWTASPAAPTAPRAEKINTTLLGWLGLEREQVVGRMRFADLLTVGGKLYHETHFAPLLQVKGEVNGIALDQSRRRDRLAVLETSQVKTNADGELLLIRTTVFDARERRAYRRHRLINHQPEERHRGTEPSAAGYINYSGPGVPGQHRPDPRDRSRPAR